MSRPPLTLTTCPVALKLLQAIRDQYNYSRQGVTASIARDLCGIHPNQLSRTSFYRRFVMLREAGLIELDGKRWRPVYYRNEFRERNRVA